MAEVNPEKDRAPFVWHRTPPRKPRVITHPFHVVHADVIEKRGWLVVIPDPKTPAMLVRGNQRIRFTTPSALSQKPPTFVRALYTSQGYVDSKSSDNLLDLI